MIGPSGNRRIDMIVIGTSAGGVDALMQVLPAFKSPSHLSAALVIHLPSRGNNLIPKLVTPDCDFKVKEAEPNEVIKPETIYVASPDYHLCLEPNHTLTFSSEDLVNFSRPSIDILFESAAYAYKKNLMGILLTGSNNDGARGLETIQEQGGMTVIQDPHGLEFPTMPQSGINLIHPDFILNLEGICDLISRMTAKDQRYGNR